MRNTKVDKESEEDSSNKSPDGSFTCDDSTDTENYEDDTGCGKKSPGKVVIII